MKKTSGIDEQIGGAKSVATEELIVNSACCSCTEWPYGARAATKILLKAQIM